MLYYETIRTRGHKTSMAVTASINHMAEKVNCIEYCGNIDEKVATLTRESDLACRDHSAVSTIHHA